MRQAVVTVAARLRHGAADIRKGQFHPSTFPSSQHRANQMTRAPQVNIQDLMKLPSAGKPRAP